MLGYVLLTVGIVGLLMTLISLVGFDFGDFDVHLGDSGVGLVSVAMPFFTGLGLLAGGLITFDVTSTLVALLVGLATGVLLSILTIMLIGYLVGSEEELPSFDLIGSTVRIVEPATGGRLGTAEVTTPLGARQITVRSTDDLAHNSHAVVLEKADDREIFTVSPLTFGDSPH